MSSLYIVIPAYNESENIEKTIDQWYPVVERHNDEGNSRLVIINDGSKDNTYELLQKCAATRPLLVPLDKPNGGHGPTVLYGYRYAIRQKADYIFQTDSDGQTNPDEFEPFWNQRGRYDAIIGSRAVRGDGKSRKFVENVVCFLLRMIFGVKVSDANAPYRLMKSSLVAKYIDKLPEDLDPDGHRHPGNQGPQKAGPAPGAGRERGDQRLLHPRSHKGGWGGAGLAPDVQE